MDETRQVTTSFYGVNPKKERLNPTFADNTPFDPSAMAAASWDYPLGTFLRIFNMETGVQEIVEVKDRGPGKRLLADSKNKKGKVVKGRQLDLTIGAYEKLGLDTSKGLSDVVIEPIGNRYASAIAQVPIRR